MTGAAQLPQPGETDKVDPDKTEVAKKLIRKIKNYREMRVSFLARVDLALTTCSLIARFVLLLMLCSMGLAITGGLPILGDSIQHLTLVPSSNSKVSASSSNANVGVAASAAANAIDKAVNVAETAVGQEEAQMCHFLSSFGSFDAGAAVQVVDVSYNLVTIESSKPCESASEDWFKASVSGLSEKNATERCEEGQGKGLNGSASGDFILAQTEKHALVYRCGLAFDKYLLDEVWLSSGMLLIMAGGWALSLLIKSAALYSQFKWLGRERLALPRKGMQKRIYQVVNALNNFTFIIIIGTLVPSTLIRPLQSASQIEQMTTFPVDSNYVTSVTWTGYVLVAAFVGPLVVFMMLQCGLAVVCFPCMFCLLQDCKKTEEEGRVPSNYQLTLIVIVQFFYNVLVIVAGIALMIKSLLQFNFDLSIIFEFNLGFELAVQINIIKLLNLLVWAIELAPGRRARSCIKTIMTRIMKKKVKEMMQDSAGQQDGQDRSAPTLHDEDEVVANEDLVGYWLQDGAEVMKGSVGKVKQIHKYGIRVAWDELDEYWILPDDQWKLSVRSSESGNPDRQ